MLISSAFILASLNLGFFAAASPVKRDNAIDDTTVLQYALTLEHLENAFYSGALAKFDNKAFLKAGFPNGVRDRFVQIGKHEASHVAFLTKALGDKATAPCEYNFPYTDPKSFAALSMAVESVGSSAYLGAAQFISNKDYLTAAGSILTVEARHDSYVSSVLKKEVDRFSDAQAYATPLGPNGVFSIAAQFITSCPSTNPALPVKTLPKITLSPAAPTAGGKLTISGVSAPSGTKASVVYYSGLQVLMSPLNSDGTTTVPESLAHAGVVYIAVLSSDSATSTDSNLMSGLAITNFPVKS